MSCRNCRLISRIGQYDCDRADSTYAVCESIGSDNNFLDSDQRKQWEGALHYIRRQARSSEVDGTRLCEDSPSLKKFRPDSRPAFFLVQFSPMFLYIHIPRYRFPARLLWKAEEVRYLAAPISTVQDSRWWGCRGHRYHSGNDDRAGRTKAERPVSGQQNPSPSRISDQRDH